MPRVTVALTAEGFERLLSAFSSDRETAGEQFELVRLKLVRYFELRMCTNPDDLADEAIDRVARRLAEGERIASPEIMRYVYGVARNVLLESWKTQSRRQRSLAAVPSLAAETVDAEKQSVCLRRCLEKAPAASRDLLLQYYRDVGRAKIDRRSALAKQMGIPLNALRIRIHRLKSELQRCVEQCMKERS
jgi:DNA-directed RNA polymerase specialized sigma24 family protein